MLSSVLGIASLIVGWAGRAQGCRAIGWGRSSAVSMGMILGCAKPLLKACIHELGHTLNLPHCQDYGCRMTSSHSVECIELGQTRLGDACRHQLESNGAL